MSLTWTPERLQEVATLRASGHKWSEIAQKMECSVSAVRGAFDRGGPVSDETTALKAQVKHLNNLVDMLSSKLKAARKPVKPTNPIKPRPVKGSYIRVAIPDIHGCYHDPDAVGAMLYDLEKLQPHEIVILGDLIDCGGFLAEHHTWGYVAESDYSYVDDTASANMVLDKIQEVCPEAKIYYIEGNHERRVETWCLTAVARSRKAGGQSLKDINLLRSILAPEQVLNLDERGIEYFKQGEYYHGLSIRSTIRLGHCHFTHGTRTGVSACRSTLNDFGASVCFGHTHQINQATGNSVKHGTMAAWNLGCLSELQPLWNHDRKTQWNHGYGVQFVQPSGKFLHITVQIVDGESMLIPLTEKVT